jgi:hypothetical protein
MISDKIVVFLYKEEMTMFISKKYLYGVIIFACGMYTHQQEAGNLLIYKQMAESIAQHIPRKKECFDCRLYARENENPLWKPCKKEHWLHDVCKLGSPFKTTSIIQSCFFQRNRSGLIPLSMAIFRGKKEIERENSRTLVAFITGHVGKDVLNMAMLCDHHQCSAWMHSIYCGDEVVVSTILSAVKRQTDDPEAVWKLLMNKDSGREGHPALTSLMVAVKKRNIPIIKVLKDAAGTRMGEYLQVESRSKNTAIDFAGDDAEILQLLLVEGTH